jgi:hypothetical protein
MAAKATAAKRFQGEAPEYDERRSQRDLMRRKRAQTYEITIPKAKNPRRRKKAAKSLLAFCQSYFSKPPSLRYPGMPAWFSTKPSAMHLEIIADIERTVFYGGNMALAAPRGGGKDTLLKIAAMWATLNGHSMYPVVAAFKESFAERMLGDIKSQLECNDWLCEDYPEVCVPIRALEGAAQRARTQTVNDQQTRMVWGQNYIVLPSVKGSAASGRVIGTGSINGAIRGLNVNGLRPDLVVMTDPQDRDIANNPDQVKEKIRLIRQDFGGLGGHIQPLAAFALVTVIKKNDVADRLINRKLHPEWNGRKYQAFLSMPKNMHLWEQYEELVRRGQETETDPTGREANRFYLDNRAAMDEGAQSYWPDAYYRTAAPDGTQLESSNIQHLMNKRYTVGHEAFDAEYQNDPEDENQTVYGLVPESLVYRQSDYEHNIVPEGAACVVQGIDIGDKCLHCVVYAVMPDASAYLVNHWRHDYKNEIDPDLHEKDTPFTDPLDKIVLTGLRRRRSEVNGGLLKTVDGQPARVTLTLVDSGHRNDVVYEFIRESGPAWRPIKGQGRTQGQEKFNLPKGGDGIGIGDHYYSKIQPGQRVKLYHLDTDYWKHQLHDSLTQQQGTPGSLVCFRADAWVHREFASSMVSERWSPEDGRWIVEHKHLNHFFDCAYLCWAAARMCGVKRLQVPREQAPQQPQRRQTGRMNWVNRGGSGDWWNRRR